MSSIAGDVFFFFFVGGGAVDEGGGRGWEDQPAVADEGKWDEMSDLVRSCWAVRDAGGGEQLCD